MGRDAVVVDPRWGPDYPATKEQRDDELDRMAENIRWLKVWGHLRMKRPTVSREKALDLAREVADARGRTVAEVVDLEELDARGARGPLLYQVNPSDCWIACLTPLGVGLGPTEIVLIDKKTGAVRYTGSAHDEG